MPAEPNPLPETTDRPAGQARAAGQALLASPRVQAVLALAAVTLALFWSCWPTLAALAGRWSTDPQYSHGFLVPVFALVVLWQWRDGCPVRGLQPSWGGLSLLLVAAVMRLVAAYFYLEPLDAFSLVPALAGLVWLAFGWRALRWAWPAVAFLGFMLPLPFQIETMLAQPLRRLATVASTYALQMLGYPALAEGNHILIDEVRLGVADACSGLGMLMTFFALATAVVLILQPRWFDRVVLVASAIPIALIANVARITLTGIVHVGMGTDAGQFVHDHAGWLMMPLALALLWLEVYYLGRLLVPVEESRPLALNLQPSPPALPYARPPGAAAPVPPCGPEIAGNNYGPARGGREAAKPRGTGHRDSLSESR